MPNSNSAKKRLRQNTARRLRNRMAETEYRDAAKKLDRAGARNIIHPNKAARTKSRLQQLIKKSKQSD